MTYREKHLLWLLLKFSIIRYLLSNVVGRIDGVERADRHIYISNILCAYILGYGGEYAVRGLHDEFISGWSDVHRWLSVNLTDYMDEKIGFIIDRPMRSDEIDECAVKFFNFICDHISEIEEVVLKAEHRQHVQK